MRRAQALAVLAVLVPLAVPRPAAAFVRYVTQDNAPFFWAQEAVAITGYPNDFTQTNMSIDQVTAAVAGAAAAWSKQTNSCTYLELSTSMSQAPTPLATNDGHNSLIFHNDNPGPGWCHVAANGSCDITYDASALAVTTDTANTMTGQIYDADVEVNLVDYQWADVVEDPTLASDMDLQNALTHEFGHLIGLDHTCFDPATSATGVRPDDNTGKPIPDCSSASPEVQATVMFPSATPGDIGKRILHMDDLNAVCTIYSINNPPPSVNSGCAQCAAAGGPPRGGALAVLAGLALVLVRRRARPGVPRT